MISFKSFEGPDGKIDWDGYRKAEIAAGDRCYKCGSMIIFGRGYRDQCASCKSLEEDKGEVWHDDKVRCPKCRHLMQVHGSELYDLYDEGEHDVSCQNCDHDFTVSTRVSHSFQSPELIEESAESESGEGQ